MGITYDLHQLRYLSSTKAIYIQIPEGKLEAVTDHVRRHLGWGTISTGTFPSANDDEEGDQGANLFLGLRMPEGHKRGVEKNDVIAAAKKKGIILDTKDFDLEFFNARNYKIRLANEELANDLRHQANFVLHGVDVYVTSWRRNRFQEYFSVTIANIGGHVNRAELVRLVSSYAGEPAMSASHLKDDFGLLRPVSIIGFATPQGQAKALELNGTSVTHTHSNASPHPNTNAPTQPPTQERRRGWEGTESPSRSPAPSPTRRRTSWTKNGRSERRPTQAAPNTSATPQNAGECKQPNARRNTAKQESTSTKTTSRCSTTRLPTNARSWPLPNNKTTSFLITLALFLMFIPTALATPNSKPNNTQHTNDTKHLNITFTFQTQSLTMPLLAPVTRKQKRPIAGRANQTLTTLREDNSAFLREKLHEHPN
jgi:hypothetical protein